MHRSLALLTLATALAGCGSSPDTAWNGSWRFLASEKGSSDASPESLIDETISPPARSLTMTIDGDSGSFDTSFTDTTPAGDPTSCQTTRGFSLDRDERGRRSFHDGPTVVSHASGMTEAECAATSVGVVIGHGAQVDAYAIRGGRLVLRFSSGADADFVVFAKE